MCAVHNREVRYACKFWLVHLKIGDHINTGTNVRIILKWILNIGVTWVITWGGELSTCVRNLNLQKSQVRKRRKMGSNPFSLLALLQLCKGKAVPLQAWRSGPEGSRKLRFPDFMTMAQDGGKVVSLTHRPPLPPGNTPGTHFCWRLSHHSATGRIMSLKNLNDTIGNRPRDLPVCSVVP